MDTEDPKSRGWWWQALRDPRAKWASTTKLQVLVACFVSSSVVVLFAIMGSVPDGFAELLGTYMAIIIIGRGASKALSVWEKKGGKDVDSSSSNP